MRAHHISEDPVTRGYREIARITNQVIDSVRMEVTTLASPENRQSTALTAFIAFGLATEVLGVGGIVVYKALDGYIRPVSAAAIDQDLPEPTKFAVAVQPTATPVPTLAPTATDAPTKVIRSATVAPTPKSISPPSGEKIITPRIIIDAKAQTLNLNCEATGAASIARNAGYKDITADKLMAILLKMGDGNPYHGFVGNPNGKPGSVGDAGYGVYPSAIAEALAQMGVKAEAEEGKGLDYIHSQLALNRPVLAVVVWGLPDTAPTVTWLAKDKTLIAGVPYEHTLVVLEETEHYYHVYNSQPTKDHPMDEWVLKTQFKKTFDLMGGQTLVVPPKQK